MKKSLLFLFAAVSLLFFACSKGSESTTEADAARYAAEMAGDYRLETEVIVYEEGQVVESYDVQGAVTLTQLSGNRMSLVLVDTADNHYTFTGTVNASGVFHHDTFTLAGIQVSELSSTLKNTTSQLLEGKLRCELLRGSQTREAELTITATRK